MPVKKKVVVKKSVKNNRRVSIIAAAIVVALLILLLVIKLLAVPRVEEGSLVSADYTLYLEDGTVYSTSVESIGVAAGLGEADYTPLNFTVGNGELIAGFEEELLGLREGSKKKFTLTPDRAYGYRSDESLREFNRDINLTRYSNISIESYEKAFKNVPKIGEKVKLPGLGWNFEVVSVSSDQVMLGTLFNQGDLINLPLVNWESEILGMDDELVFVRQNPSVGNFISTPTNPKFAVVIDVGDDTFIADANNPLAGKTITFEVEVISVQN